MKHNPDFMAGFIFGALTAFMTLRILLNYKQQKLLNLITQNRHLHPANILERIKRHLLNEKFKLF